MSERQVPGWQDHLGQVESHAQQRLPAPFAPGTKTMRRHEMDSANRRHAADLAAQMQMHNDRMAMQKWAAEMDYELQLMQMQAAKAASQDGHSLDAAIMAAFQATQSPPPTGRATVTPGIHTKLPPGVGSNVAGVSSGATGMNFRDAPAQGYSPNIDFGKISGRY